MPRSVSAADRSARTTRWLVRASGLVMVVAIAWFLANIDHPREPLLLLWAPNSVAAAIIVVLFALTSRNPALLHPTRRFWRHLALSALLVGGGTVAQAIDGLRHPLVGGQHTGPVMLALDATAILVIIWALLRLPLGAQSRGERLRVALDAGTLMVATSVFVWHFHTRHLLAQGIDRHMVLVSSGIVAILGLVGVFAVAKVTLSSHAFVDKVALRLLACAMLTGCLTPVPERLLSHSPQLVGTQLIIPIVLFLCALSAQRQLRAAPAARGSQRRRRYSFFPYFAVAAIDALLVWVLADGETGGQLLIGCAAVLVTGLVVLRQVTAFQDNQRLLARLDHSATHDALTHLPNRRLFNQRLQQALGGPGSHHVSIALIDLDDFKTVNDTLGHDVGDALLVGVAERLLGCVRPGDTVARLGGDEFVLILDGVAARDADACVERIIGALAAPVTVHGHELLVRASIGIAEGRTGDEPGDLLREADIAMYAAKTVGGSGYRRYEPNMAATITGSAELTDALRRAIAEDQLFLLYQPIVDLDDGRLVGVEALVRWAHPVRGIVPPDEFIPVAERTGLVVQLGRSVLRKACAQLATWIEQFGAAAPVLNVNVSARELREPSFADDVAAVLTSTGIPPHLLTVEITETAVLEPGFSVVNLRALRELGVHIALDDFGTGHSTLTLLQSCPADQLKLDRSFTQGEEPVVAAGVLHLAGALGLHVVAEGVETAEQADRMRLLGYTQAQGFHFARPMPAAHIDQLLVVPNEILTPREPAQPRDESCQIS